MRIFTADEGIALNISPIKGSFVIFISLKFHDFGAISEK
jgi:hypothetical protein